MKKIYLATALAVTCPSQTAIRQRATDKN
ncbi:uncharacterized protein METZ01_LOCUS155816, partial [marine metagenome]